MANFKEILKHGANYLAANLATKALAFISIPIYTRILSTHDYGIVSIFIGVSGILSNLLTLCIDQSVSRYYWDRKSDDDFKEFVGTSLILSSLVFLINSVIVFSNAEWIGQLVNLDKEVVYLLIPYALVNIIGLMFDQIYGPMKMSRKIAMSSLCRVYLGFAFALLFIFIFREKKYLGQILGLLMAGTLMIVYWYFNIRKFTRLKFRPEFVKYIFSYSVPLIPYALSGVIIEQFGKLTLGQTSVSTVGYYSLALTIASIVSIVTVVTHQAWAPYYFEHMKAKNYVQHDLEISRILRFTLLTAMGISIFGKEIGMILASVEFTGALGLIPIFTFGYVFHQYAYVYMRNISFVYKSFWLTVTVIVSGASNILLNLFIIPVWGQTGAAISFAISYFIMAAAAWGINKFVIRHYGTPPSKLLVPLLGFFFFSIPVFKLYNIAPFYLAILLKILLMTAFIIFIAWPERVFLLQFINRRSKKP